MQKFLTVAVSEDEYTRFQEESRSKGQSISARARELLGFRDDPVTDLVQDMIKRVGEYPPDTSFPLRALFTDKEWKAHRSAKTHAGIRFYGLVQVGRLRGIKKGEKDREGTQCYLRTGKVELIADDTLDTLVRADFEEMSEEKRNALRKSFIDDCNKLWEKHFTPPKVA
jgi:hypothetical protein